MERNVSLRVLLAGRLSVVNIITFLHGAEASSRNDSSFCVPTALCDGKVALFDVVDVAADYEVV